VLFGFGYAQAEDHLPDMLMSFLTAQGRLSEFLGPSCVEKDYQIRLLRILQFSIEGMQDTGKNIRRLISAFALGINRYVDEHPLPESTGVSCGGATDEEE